MLRFRAEVELQVYLVMVFLTTAFIWLKKERHHRGPFEITVLHETGRLMK